MGMLILGILMEGKSVMVDIPQMETPHEMGKYGVGLTTLRDCKEDTIGVPLLILINKLEG
jgi:hypothetical protein